MNDETKFLEVTVDGPGQTFSELDASRSVAGKVSTFITLGPIEFEHLRALGPDDGLPIGDEPFIFRVDAIDESRTGAMVVRMVEVSERRRRIVSLELRGHMLDDFGPNFRRLLASQSPVRVTP